MEHQRGGREAQCFQGGDLFALGGHQPSKHDIQEECRHPEEDDGDGDRHDLLLIEFILEEAVRRLIPAGDGADRTIRLEQPVEFIDHLLRVDAGNERHDGVVEGAFHIEGRLRRAAVDPENGVEPVVRDRYPRLHRIDIFRRQRDGRDMKALKAPVQHHRQFAAECHRVGLGKRLVDRGVLRDARLRRAASTHMQSRQRLIAGMRQRHHARRNRQRRRWPIQDYVPDDAGLDRGDPGNLPELRHHRKRRALQRDEHLREAGACVEAITPCTQGAIGRYRSDKDGHAGRDHQRNRDHLAAHGPDIPQQLAIEQAHQRTSFGVSLCGLRSSPTMRPPPRRRTRSAMPAMAALWVMMTVVVPSSSLARAMAASTTFPVS